MPCHAEKTKRRRKVPADRKKANLRRDRKETPTGRTSSKRGEARKNLSGKGVSQGEKYGGTRKEIRKKS